MKLKNIRFKGKLLIAAFGLVVAAGAVYAQTTDLSQQIDAGTLETAILDSGRETVANPGVNFTGVNFDFDCQTTTATLGTDSERIYVTNPSATTGWTLSVAATGASAEWDDGEGNTYAYNDPSGAGCDNGQLSVDPGENNITYDCETCGLTGLSEGSASAFDSGTIDNITLMQASGADEVWRGYITDIDLSQEIPGETPAGEYALDMTLTVTSQ